MPHSTTVLITGAAGNLGACVAHALARHGARLALVDRTAEMLAPVLAGLPVGTQVLPLSGYDLTSEASLREIVASVEAQFGALTGLVNTVGIFKMGRVADEANAQWDLMMQVNARIPLITSAAVLPTMVKGGFGRIVHIAAGPGVKSSAGMAAYAASKAAVIRLIETIADEHAGDHITANCILPGTIDTPQNRAAMPDADTSTWVSPEAIAELIAYLVSPQGGVVTGAAIPATGRG